MNKRAHAKNTQKHKAGLKRISDAAIKTALKSDISQLYDSRRVELRINKGRTGGTFFDVVFVGKKRVRTQLAKWPAISAKALFDELPAIRAEKLAAKRDTLRVSEFEDCSDLLMWFMQHIDEDKTFSVAYVSTASSYIGNHLLTKLGDAALKDVNKTLIYKQLYLPLLADYALSTIKGVFTVFKRALSLAASLELIANDPLKHVTYRQFTTDNPPQNAGRLKPHDLSKLVSAINKQAPMRRTFFLMQLLHGTRISETSLIKWSYLSLDHAKLYLPSDITKNGKEHRLPLSPQIVNILREHKRHSQSCNVFSFGGDRFISSRTINNWCSELSHKVGIKFTSHDLRKLTADSLQDRGVNSEVIEMILNHSQGDLDKVYKQRYSQSHRSVKSV